MKLLKTLKVVMKRKVIVIVICIILTVFLRHISSSLTKTNPTREKRVHEVEKVLVKLKNQTILEQEFLEILMRNSTGTFKIGATWENFRKNRHFIPMDQSRVILKRKDNSSSDYINANFVDGWSNEKKVFIATQAPLPSTAKHFWMMVWQEKVLVISMLTGLVEKNVVKCFPYWKAKSGEKVIYGDLKIKTVSVEKHQNYKKTKIEIKHMKTNETRPLNHFFFTSWPDLDVPKSATKFLEFLLKVKAKQAEMMEKYGMFWVGNRQGPPIVVHCSAGIGRAGTFMTIYNSIARFEEDGTIDVKEIVKKIRTQRAAAVTTTPQYVFCNKAIARYANSTLNKSKSWFID